MMATKQEQHRDIDQPSVPRFVCAQATYIANCKTHNIMSVNPVPKCELDLIFASYKAARGLQARPSPVATLLRSTAVINSVAAQTPKIQTSCSRDQD